MLLEGSVMMIELFSGFEIGKKYRRKGWPCQDYAASADLGASQIIAVADGHGSYDCFRSHIGSKFAVEIAVDMIRNGAYFRLPKQKSGDICDNKQDYESDQTLRDDKSLVFYEDEVVSFKKKFWEKWRQKVRDDWDEKLKQYQSDSVSEDLSNVIGDTEERFKTVSEKYKERYLSQEKAEQYLYTAYGTTLILAVYTESCTLLLQIGDGTCVVLYKNGKFDTPVPIEEDNFLNVTTSLCEDKAYSKIRHKILTLTKVSDDLEEDFNPVAIFLSSDGVDDCYPVYQNSEYLYRLYKVILDDLAKCSTSEDIEKVKDDISTDLFTYMTDYSSQDDVSLAFIVDTNKFKSALDLVKLSDIQQSNKFIELKDSDTAPLLESNFSSSEIKGSYAFQNAETERRIRIRPCKDVIDCYNDAYEYGHPGACYWLGYLIENGIDGDAAESSKEFYEKAFTEASRLYDNGCKDACLPYVLGACYGKGKYVEQSNERAKEYYKEAAELGYPEAEYEYALLCNNDGKKEEAEKYFTEAANSGLIEAKIDLGRFKYEQKDYDGAYNILSGVVSGKSHQFKFEKYLDKATCYLARTCKKKGNYDEAIKYFKLVEQSYPLSYFSIGECYVCDDNYRLAVDYFSKFLNLKDIDNTYIGKASYYLSFCYAKLKKFTSAIDYCRKCLNSGYNPEKANDLLSGCLYVHGNYLLNSKGSKCFSEVSDIITELHELERSDLADELRSRLEAPMAKPTGAKLSTSNKIDGVMLKTNMKNAELTESSICKSRERYREALNNGIDINEVEKLLLQISKSYEDSGKLDNDYHIYTFLAYGMREEYLEKIYSTLSELSDLFSGRIFHEDDCVKKYVDDFMNASGKRNDKAVEALISLADIFEKGRGVCKEIKLAYLLYKLANCLGSECAYKKLQDWVRTKNDAREADIYDMEVCEDVHLYYEYLNKDNKKCS